MHCGQDVPWTASTKDGRLACSRCGLSPENPSEIKDIPPVGHVPLNIPIKDLHGAHCSAPKASKTSSSSNPSRHPGNDVHSWPVASAYDGWDLDEQLTHIREVLDSLSNSASSDSASLVDDEDSFFDSDTELAQRAHRFDARHHEKRGLHRRAKKNDSLMGRFVFGLVFLMLGTGILALSIASILPRQIWFPADVPIGAVLLQVFGAFLAGLGLSAQIRHFQSALHVQETNQLHRRFDEPQMQRSPHVDVKVRS